MSLLLWGMKIPVPAHGIKALSVSIEKCLPGTLCILGIKHVNHEFVRDFLWRIFANVDHSIVGHDVLLCQPSASIG
jgi:hypothetical protein